MAQAEAADTNFAVMGDAEAAGRRPACLIVEPVKELAAQVYDQVPAIAHFRAAAT